MRGNKRKVIIGTPQLPVFSYSTVSTNWRAPITAAYINSVLNVGMTNSSINKANAGGTIPASQTAYPLVWILTSPLSTPGGLFNFQWGTVLPTTFMIEYSTDATNATDGTWTQIQYTAFPTPRLGLGDAVVIPTGSIGVRMKVTSSSTAGGFSAGLFQLNVDQSKNDFGFLIGMSISINSYGTSTLRKLAQIVDPNRDPVCIITAQASSRLVTNPPTLRMLADQIQPAINKGLPFGWCIFEHGPNDSVENAASVYSDMIACYQALSTLEAQGTQVFTSGSSFNYAFSNKAFTDFPNSGAGIEFLRYYPPKRSFHPKGAVDLGVEIAFIDMTTPIALYYPAALGSDGLHPEGQFGTRQYLKCTFPAWQALSGVTPDRPILKQTVDYLAASASGVPLYFKNRLAALVANLPNASSKLSQKTRADMAGKVASLSTSYVETAGGIPGSPVAVFDFDDFSKVTTQRTITCTTTAGSDIIACLFANDLVLGAPVTGTGIPVGSVVSAINPIAKTLSILPNTATATGSTALVFNACGEFITQMFDSVAGYRLFSRPLEADMGVHMPGVLNGRGAYGTGRLGSNGLGAGVMLSTDTPFITAWDAAGQDFAFACTFRQSAFESSFGVPPWTVSNVGFSWGDPALAPKVFGGIGETTSYTANKVYYLVVTKSGTTLNIRRNGVQTATGSFTKTATTSTSFHLGGNSTTSTPWIGELGLWYGATSAYSGLALTDLENWLAKKCGY